MCRSRRAEHDLLERVGELVATHRLAPTMSGKQRGLVDEVAKVRADHSGR